MTLADRVATAKRLALVGLAKNTGKTETLAALLRELEVAERRVGVTSIGRDGEERDVIDPRVAKPRVTLPAGSLVATTTSLLRASGLPHELLERTDIRTPLGEVQIARLRGKGEVEVAGPSTAAGIRAVSDAMLDHGARLVLIDGAIDRRVASSPDVADSLVLATGAVLSPDLEEVVARTVDAVELVRLEVLEEDGPDLRAAAEARDAHSAGALVADARNAVALPERFVLTSEPEQIAQLLASQPDARWLFVAGAVPEGFLDGLLLALRRRRRTLVLVAADPTKVFLSRRGPGWYRRQGLDVKVLRTLPLSAITVNPLAPGAHRFDSRELRAQLAQAIPDVPICDVLHQDYATG